MGVHKGFLLLIIILLCTSAASATKLTGAIYDHDLTPIKKAIITINTTPEQTRVSQYGGYHFIVDPGTYLITATFSKNDITKEIASEQITVAQEGEFVRDLFLYPDFVMQEEFEDTFSNKLQSFFAQHGILIGLITGALIILALITIFGTKYVKLLFKRELKQYVKEQRQQKIPKDEPTAEQNQVSEKKTPPKTEQSLEIKPQADSTLHQSMQAKTDAMIQNKILIILKKNTDNLSTQKAIRKEFRLSEAKISHVLTEMENKGLILKVKQGRRNVIKLTVKKN